MFHLFSALRCIIRSSAWLFPVTVLRVKTCLPQEKLQIWPAKVCMARSIQRDKAQMVLVTPLKWEMNNMRSGCMSQAEGMRWRTRSLNHKERPQTPQRREQRASKCCHLKPGAAETMAAHVQVSESRFLFTSSDSLDTEDEDVLVSEASLEMINFTRIWTFSPKRLVSVTSDSGSVFRFWH